MKERHDTMETEQVGAMQGKKQNAGKERGWHRKNKRRYRGVKK